MVDPFGDLTRRIRGFFVVYVRVYGMHCDPWWSRWYWALRTWNKVGRGRNYVS